VTISSIRIIERFADLLKIDPGSQKIYLVGGIVRDLILNRENKDIDILCEFDAKGFARRLAEAKKGAFYVLDETRNTCRVITYESGTKLVYDFAQQQSSLIGDLMARDFTINAMAIDLAAPDILIDPLNGLGDLNQGILRPCSATSFSSDPVRVIRAVRYANAYQLKIELDTLELLMISVKGLQTISGERKRDELFKLMDLSDPIPALEMLQEFGILSELGIPNVSQMKFEMGRKLVQLIQFIEEQHQISGECFLPGFEKIAKYSSHYAKLLQQKNSSDRRLSQLLILASMLAEFEPDDVRKVAKRLRLSKEEFERLLVIQTNSSELTRLSDQPDLISDRSLYLFIKKTDVECLDLCLFELAKLAANDASGNLNNQEKDLNLVEKIFGSWFDRQNVVNPVPFLNGKDLMINFDLPPGVLIGKLLEQLKEEQAAGTVLNRDQALEWMEGKINTYLNERHWNQ
jgi:poly(A) polymerase